MEALGTELRSLGLEAGKHLHPLRNLAWSYLSFPKNPFKKKSLAIHLTIGTLSMTTGHFTYNIPFLYDTMFNKEKFGQ